jgi:hypothetical protein
MKTPKASFHPSEGRVLTVLLWVVSFAALAGLVWVWRGAEKARPVLLNLETGQPVSTPVPHR